MSTLEVKELSHPAGQVIKIASGKTLDLKSQGSVTMPTGSVLQVIHVKGSGGDLSTSSTSYVASGIQASITPQSANSKIMVIFDSIAFTRSSNNEVGVGVSIYRGGSEPSPTMRGGVRRLTGGDSYWIDIPYSISALDSPNTTNAVVYEAYFKCWGASGHMFVDHLASKPTLTLMEIQG